MQEVEKLEQTFKQRVLQQSNDQQGKTVSVILSTCQQGVPLSQNMHHRLRWGSTQRATKVTTFWSPAHKAGVTIATYVNSI